MPNIPAKVAHILDDHLRATLPETPPAATEHPAGLVWRKQGCVETAEGPWWSMTARPPYRGEAGCSWWVVHRSAEKGSRILGDGDAPTLDAAKAAAEACLRAWVARLNASLGIP